MFKFSLHVKCQLEISDYIQYDQINWDFHGTLKLFHRNKEHKGEVFHSRKEMAILYKEFVQRMQSICRKPSGYPAAEKRGNKSEEVVEGHKGSATEKDFYKRRKPYTKRKNLIHRTMWERSTMKPAETVSKTRTSGPEVILMCILNQTAS